VRYKHKRSWIGYSSKSVEKAVAALRSEYKEQKESLESELAEYKRSKHILFQEIIIRKQELIEHVRLEKELDELLQQANQDQNLHRDALNMIELKQNEWRRHK
jgi:hypothetical protein